MTSIARTACVLCWGQTVRAGRCCLVDAAQWCGSMPLTASDHLPACSSWRTRPTAAGWRAHSWQTSWLRPWLAAHSQARQRTARRPRKAPLHAPCPRTTTPSAAPASGERSYSKAAWARQLVPSLHQVGLCSAPVEVAHASRPAALVPLSRLGIDCDACCSLLSILCSHDKLYCRRAADSASSLGRPYSMASLLHSPREGPHPVLHRASASDLPKMSPSALSGSLPAHSPRNGDRSAHRHPSCEPVVMGALPWSAKPNACTPAPFSRLQSPASSMQTPKLLHCWARPAKQGQQSKPSQPVRSSRRRTPHFAFRLSTAVSPGWGKEQLALQARQAVQTSVEAALNLRSARYGGLIQMVSPHTSPAGGASQPEEPAAAAALPGTAAAAGPGRLPPKSPYERQDGAATPPEAPVAARASAVQVRRRLVYSCRLVPVSTQAFVPGACMAGPAGCCA